MSTCEVVHGSILNRLVRQEKANRNLKDAFNALVQNLNVLFYEKIRFFHHAGSDILKCTCCDIKNTNAMLNEACNAPILRHNNRLQQWHYHPLYIKA